MLIHLASSLEGRRRQEIKEWYSSHEHLYDKKNFYEYYCSRLALLDCFDEMNIPLNISYTEIENHLHIKQHPHFLVSLTHTKVKPELFVGAALLAHKNEAQSVGVDLELASRHIKPETIRHLDESDNWDDLLWLWTVKEAAYKAISPLEKPILKNIKIDKLAGSFQHNEIQGVFQWQQATYENEEFYLASAWVI